FHFHNDTRARSIERADLHLYIDKPETNPEERREVSINVFESAERGEKGELLASHRVLTPAHGPSHHRVRLNGQALERIAQSDSTVLIVEAFVDDVNLIILLGDDDAAGHPMSLSLVMSVSRGRSRRSVKMCDRDAPAMRCRPAAPSPPSSTSINSAGTTSFPRSKSRQLAALDTAPLVRPWNARQSTLERFSWMQSDLPPVAAIPWDTRTKM
ncbi:hypothetical protein PMAYCL1PPCAC_30596, partial [Pristionchus mayeri]